MRTLWKMAANFVRIISVKKRDKTIAANIEMHFGWSIVLYIQHLRRDTRDSQGVTGLETPVQRVTRFQQVGSIAQYSATF